MTIIGGSPGLGDLIGVVPAMFLIRLILGVVTAPLYPACARVTANWIPLTQHARVQGFIIAGSSLGAAISPVVFVWLMGRLGWRGAFAVAAAGTGLLTAIWYTRGRDYPPEASITSRERNLAGTRWANSFAIGICN